MFVHTGRHGILCDIERIEASNIDVAYNRTVAGDVKYRFVIDTSTF
jgi:alcohol dehydrogenase (NADP+)